MKTILFAVLSLQLCVFALPAAGLRADGRREFISKTMNSDVQKLLKDSGREIIGVEPLLKPK